MEILLVTTELSPWVSSTDTPDEVFALAKTFRQLGHDVSILAPFDNAFERGGLLLARRLTPITLNDGRAVTIFDAQLSSGAKMVLLGLPSGADARLASGDAPEPATIAAESALAQAVVLFVAQRVEQGQPFDVVHLFDWTTALIAPAIRDALQSSSPAVVLSVHDERKTGSFEQRIGSALDDELLRLESLRYGESCSSLRAGILAADGIVVPSESHIELLARSSDTIGLGSWFGDQPRPVYAVQPGVDYSRVNPATNPCLVSRYDAQDSAAKLATKMAVLRELGLELQNRPFVMFPGPITEDGGGDLILEAMDQLLEQPLALCIWSTANDSPSLVEELNRRVSERRGTAVHCTYKSEDDLHRGFAAADFVVCPHRHLGGRIDHLAAQRYGAVVVALDSPGLRDVIVDCDAALETGTGFLFGEPSAVSLCAAVMRANAAFYHPNFQRLRRRVMRQDCSWERPARRMLQIYKKALASRPRGLGADTAESLMRG